MLFDSFGKEVLYLDPGSGSFILQLIIAGFVGALFVLRGYWSRLLGLFRKSDDDNAPGEEAAHDHDER